MFKTIYHRLRAQKKLNDSYKLLEEGACMQLREGHFTCGVELGQLLVEVRIWTSVACHIALRGLRISCPQGNAPYDFCGAQAYTRDSASCSRDNLHRIYKVIENFPRQQNAADGQNDAVEQCTKITLAAIKWGQR